MTQCQKISFLSNGLENSSLAVVDKELSKKKGDFFVAKGFDYKGALHPSLLGPDGHCEPFQVVGHSCEDPTNCKKKHRPSWRWTPEEQHVQVKHMDVNNGKIWFNSRSVRWLPENKKYMMGQEQGPTQGN